MVKISNSSLSLPTYEPVNSTTEIAPLPCCLCERLQSQRDMYAYEDETDNGSFLRYKGMRFFF